MQYQDISIVPDVALPYTQHVSSTKIEQEDSTIQTNMRTDLSSTLLPTLTNKHSDIQLSDMETPR